MIITCMQYRNLPTTSLIITRELFTGRVKSRTVVLKGTSQLLDPCIPHRICFLRYIKPPFCAVRSPTSRPHIPPATVIGTKLAYSREYIIMFANTLTTSLARSASTLAGPVSTTTTTTTTTSNPPSQSPKTVPHRPNKTELEARLFHAHVRAHVRRLRQSVLGQDLPSIANPQRTTRPLMRSIPRNLPTITTKSGFFILAPTAIAPAPQSVPNAPKLGPLPTPPQTPEPETRPMLPTRRSRAPPIERTFGSCALNEFGDDPVLTPGHVFPDNLRRTPGAAIASGESRGYFHLPPGLFETPAVENMISSPTATSTATSSPGAAAPIGLGITVPTTFGRRSSTSSPVNGLGIDGVGFWEESRLERCVLTVL